MVVSKSAIGRKRVGGSRDAVLRLPLLLLPLDKAASFATADDVLIGRHSGVSQSISSSDEMEAVLRRRRSASVTLESAFALPLALALTLTLTLTVSFSTYPYPLL